MLCIIIWQDVSKLLGVECDTVCKVSEVYQYGGAVRPSLFFHLILYVRQVLHVSVFATPLPVIQIKQYTLYSFTL